ncbi:hypothetical protein C2869_18915 [Saccharobesus litoralis]|uniref:Globin n=1 Tax=Saccharobesus litoralis TaxID=2172099 RepID=A0A2S0VW04_9ALTE|nr:globin [Saccharobesus litoralis]AWB68352.1 hypothetical protein C2869_18915 [Saccharobesus litoralis]
MQDYAELFNDSYERVMQNADEFYGFFYQVFLAKDPQIKQRFAHVDLVRQISMLKNSLAYLLVCQSSEAAQRELIRLAKQHHDEYLVEVFMYDIWLDTLVEVVEEFDSKYYPEVGEAWRRTLSPAVRLMKASMQ